MQAVVYERYGSPEKVLHFKEVEKPVPAEDQVLLKVKAVGINPYDRRHVSADPFIIRLMVGGFFKPKHPIVGADVAGVVEAVGSGVSEFQPGDAVVGEIGYGGLAEYACTSAANLAHKPTNLTFEEAAAMPMAALTALQGLRDSGGIQAGQKVLINGSSGGIGTFAVQLAKHFGADVTGVCSTRNVDLVRSLGADRVIDYTQEDFSRNGGQYDLILDNVGNRSMADVKRALVPQGKGVVTGMTSLLRMIQFILLGKRGAENGGKTLTVMTAQVSKADLEYLKDLLEAGTIKSVIDRCYPFAETAAAVSYVATGHARAKVVVSVDDSPR